MQIKTPWQDSISLETPMLCRVWDNDCGKAENIYNVIDKYQPDLALPYRIKSSMSYGYKHAEPVMPDSEFLYRE